MKCPHCNKEIYGLTGLQELQAFQKHLGKCRKHPARAKRVYRDGGIKEENPKTTMMDALNIRAESGQ